MPNNDDADKHEAIEMKEVDRRDSLEPTEAAIKHVLTEAFNATDPRVIVLRDGTLQPGNDDRGRPIVHISNQIRTTKYTVYNFLFKNLYEQLSRPANFYFLVIAVLQCIRTVSISQGKPTILAPLILVLCVSALKDIVEDTKRHNEDRKENQREYKALDQNEGKLNETECQALEVGQIVKIMDGEVFPADILLLQSGARDGAYCYVETANLDGETNLKVKLVPEIIKDLPKADLAAMSKLTVEVHCDSPSGRLDAFGGMLMAKGKEGECMLNLDNLLLRGAKLRNTTSVYGLVIYTGEESKIRMNSTAKKRGQVKRSSVEHIMNRQIIGMFGLQFIVCLICAIGAGVWQSLKSDHTDYLVFEESPALSGLLRFFTWFIIFNGFVPISLLVSMELVKYFQGMFIGWDRSMVYEVGDEKTTELQFARAQTSGLNEELGQIQYVLSDKTGTLTMNSMDFRKCIIGGEQYGTGDTDISLAAKLRDSFVDLSGEVHDEANVEEAPHVNFTARKRMWEILGGGAQAMAAAKTPRGGKKGGGKAGAEAAAAAAAAAEKEAAAAAAAAALLEGDDGEERKVDPEEQEARRSEIDSYLTSLALCNTVFPTTTKDGKTAGDIVFKASSPDEECIVEYCRFMGYLLAERNPPFVTLKVTAPPHAKLHRTEKWEQLALLDFTSKRKRMTVIMRDPKGRVHVITKGADSSVQPLCQGDSPHWDFTHERLSVFGGQGLRTLAFAHSIKPLEWWEGKEDGWDARYRAKMKECAVEGVNEMGHFKGSCKAKCRRCLLAKSIETDAGLRLVGATAIEDKLQEGVPETIRNMLRANLNVWVLTGDKMETAINIGMACNLLESSMERKGRLLKLTADACATPADLKKTIEALQLVIEQAADGGAQDPFGLVVDSGAYASVMQGGPDILNSFMWIAARCKSVVACRMQPNQKSRLVELVRDTFGVRTLSVGDGANDEQMILEADVGVGIRGVEGTAAVRAADYAISQFRFLQTLLFVHGRLNYRRISLLILYIFYKNALLCFVQLWFGFETGFSGQPLFLEWAFQSYNVIFTALPILILAVLDRDVSFDALRANPYLYQQVTKGGMFNNRVYWKWIISALWQSIFIFWLPFASWTTTSNGSDGQSDGMWNMGIVVYTVVVLVVNLRIALMMRSWTWVHHLAVWGSIVVFFIEMAVFNATPRFSVSGGDYTGEFGRLAAQPKYYFTVIITTVAALLVDYMVDALERLNIPMPWNKQAHMDRQKMRDDDDAALQKQS